MLNENILCNAIVIIVHYIYIVHDKMFEFKRRAILKLDIYNNYIIDMYYM